MDCVVCGRPARVDPLCQRHKRELSTSDDLTPEQLRVKRRPQAEIVGWLIDMFGCLHPVAGETVIGRDPDRADLALLHASVSSVHARLFVSEGTLTLEDCGSTNGTLLAGESVTSPAPVSADPALLRFGSISLFFCREPAGEMSLRGAKGRTVPRSEKAGRVVLALDSGEWTLVLGADGAQLTGPEATVTLSAMEGRLLNALIDRASEPAYTPSAVLVASVGFGSRSADGDNVRELVARVRRKLAKVGLKGLIESRPRTGYRLAPAMLRLS